MKLTCLFGLHTWSGCTCTACGRTRDQEHDWSQDCEQCARCGAMRTNAHRWNRCVCTNCGQTRDKGHDWSKDCEKCNICGKTRASDHKWNGLKCKKCGIEGTISDILKDIIPSSAYPSNPTARKDCEKFIDAFYAWRHVASLRSFDQYDDSYIGQCIDMSRKLFVLLLDRCGEEKSILPVVVMRELCKLFPNSGLTWFCRAYALINLGCTNTEEKTEIAECLLKAQKYGCDYIDNGKDGLAIRVIL